MASSSTSSLSDRRARREVVDLRLWTPIHAALAQVIRELTNQRILFSSIVLILLVLAFATRSAILTASYIGVSAFLILKHLRKLQRESSVRERDVALVILIVQAVMLPISAMRSETALAHYFIAMLSFVFAWLMTRDLETYAKASRWSLVAAQVAILAYLSKSGLESFPLEDILPQSSSNGVTSYMIVLQANYCLMQFLLHRKPALFTSAVTLAICVVGYGRGSILASASLLVVSIVSCISWQRPARAIGTVAVIASIVAIAALWYSEEISFFIEANTKIGSGLYDQHRDQIITEYLAKIDASSILIGVDYRGTSVDTEYNNNPHNSFIRGHHIFGLAYIVSMLLVPLALSRRKHQFSVKAFSSAVFAIVLFRAFTEPVLFPTLFDFYYFSMAFALGRSGNASDPKGSKTP